jgi:phosphoenolpyruvate-protein phosphotransferase (PTS system enzyme I)
METLQGIPVSPGIAVGKALVIDNEGFVFPRHFVLREAIDRELQRFDVAIAAASEEVEANRNSVTTQLGEAVGTIFDAHLQMLRDPGLQQGVESLIRERNYSAEYAVNSTLGAFAKRLRESPNPVLAERAHDLVDLERCLLRHLTGRPQEELAHLTSEVVLIAHNLTPNETVRLNPQFVRGFVTEIGGAGGHTAIVAKGLEIPAVVGVGRFLGRVSTGDLVIADGHSGCVILQPDAETVARYRRETERQQSLADQLRLLRDEPAVTKDGVRIQLMANIEFPLEAPVCLERGADGIGLYRTEFLYLGSDAEPSEEDHYQAYADVVRAVPGRPVVIRTLDLGADKIGAGMEDLEPERNPVLGLRSIRLSLRHRALFMPQLRAVLRASVLGEVKLMFPLITTLTELRQAKQVLAEAKDELDARGVDFRRDLPVGMMVESPAAATMIDRFVNEVDFISIGTNDLIQYTLAVDRSNASVANLYQAADPAVLRMIAASLKAARQAGVSASLCGQMSSEALYTMLLLGMGLRELSVPPSSIPEIKRVCRSVTLAECEKVASHVQTLDNAQDIEAFLREEYQKLGL